MHDAETIMQARERLAEAIASCWIKLRNTEGFVRTTHEALLVELRKKATPLAPFFLSEESVWDALHKKFGAIEYPWGVLNFSEEQLTTALQHRDMLYSKFPRLVELVEEILPKYANT